ncbi:hypothetical protein G7Y89_g11955 [Cudoniella acicularis]|uniref:Uncharacterized protein n=1 Tax=Cudoniella acicularis TaxID=354080 RepID=A0A8H4RBD8_9HELO|nr:hypothetical protein G7Y89_g11955 [Cudoniella acicularis]
MEVESSAGITWYLKDLEHAVSRDFAKLPYFRLAGINIKIDCPDHTDPGQVVCLFNEVSGLVGLLKVVQKSFESQDDLESDIEIEISEENQVPGLPKMAFHLSIMIKIQISGFTTMCRSEPLVKIQTENGMSFEVLDVLDVQEEAMKRPNLFGTGFEPGYYGDRNISERLDILRAKYDLALDRLTCHTANMLRLERFSEWEKKHPLTGKTYVEVMQLTMCFPRLHLRDALLDRRNDFKAFNPNGDKFIRVRRRCPEQMKLQDLYQNFPFQRCRKYGTGKETFHQEVNMGQSDDGRFEEWHRDYQEELPRL